MSFLMRLLSQMVTILLLAGGVAVLMMGASVTKRFPLRTIEIHGDLKYLSGVEVQEVVTHFMKHGFFWLDVDAVQKNISHLPWVSEAWVQRVWPDQIKVNIKERVPQAIWNERGILSTEGIIFYPELSKLPEKLPRFNGPEFRAVEMLQQYFVFLEALTPLGLSLSELDVTMDGTWRIRLDNGIAIILGKSAVIDRLARFVMVFSKNLQAQSEKIAYLDLRYTNGLAIGWKPSGQIGPIGSIGPVGPIGQIGKIGHKGHIEHMGRINPKVLGDGE